MVSGRLRGLSSRGFTMAEVVVVAAVLGVFLTLAYPSVASYLRTAALRAGAQELAAILNGARQIAITRNTNVCVSLNGTNATYTTGVSSTCAGGSTFIGTNTRSDGTIPLDNSIQITASTASVVFSPLGAALTAGTFTVHNPTQGGGNMSVVVSAAGRVTIQ
jgi:type IV fimbrial biogenesis protein FimU